MKNIKKILKIAIIVIVIILIGIFSLSYAINKNDRYKENIIKNIQNNYQVNNNITYANFYGNYYIFTTNTNVIVLTKEYQEVLKEDIKYLADNINNYELIYKTNKLMYENTTIKKNKVIYDYYDAKTYKKISSTTLEK